MSSKKDKQNTMNTHYDLLSRTLHWIMAIVIIYASFAGYAMHLVIDSHPAVFHFLSIVNMSLATAASGLFILRYIWKFFRQPIESSELSNTTQHKIAKLVHSLLYFLMFIVLISGFLMVKHEYSFFWLFPVDNIITNPAVNEFFFMVHRFGCAFLSLVVLMHAGAALHHHFIKKNNTMHRMVGPSIAYIQSKQ
ncbi:cytochrome b [Psychromonas aquimarina]|uniref:cytochrome b n=1 Tax=Psychromonas aquimarina TaxID=444919 RepID=UPI001FDFF0B4|nr:cytochrome b/b6 domain-containing protein [Psychromonas aquimarina]